MTVLLTRIAVYWLNAKNFTLDRLNFCIFIDKKSKFSLAVSPRPHWGGAQPQTPLLRFPAERPPICNRNRHHCNALAVHFWCLYNARWQKDVIHWIAPLNCCWWHSPQNTVSPTLHLSDHSCILYMSFWRWTRSSGSVIIFHIVVSALNIFISGLIQSALEYHWCRPRRLMVPKRNHRGTPLISGNHCDHWPFTTHILPCHTKVRPNV